MTTLQVLSNGTQFAIGVQKPEYTHPHIFCTFPTKRKAMNALKKIEKQGAQSFIEYWSESPSGSVLGSYFAGRYTEIIVSINA